ncbi:MAG: M56 family metallopeptidase [Microgenomates group bacterium]
MSPNDFLSSCAAVGVMIFESDIWIEVLQQVGNFSVIGYALWAVLLTSIVSIYLAWLPKKTIPAKLAHLCSVHQIPLSLISCVSKNSNIAFTAGIFSPSIYVSTSLINTLSKKQLEAVLLHEFHHLKRHDTRISVALSALRGMHVVVPFLKEIESYIKEKSERSADQFVINKQGTTRYVQQALQIVTAEDALPMLGTRFAYDAISRQKLFDKSVNTQQLKLTISSQKIAKTFIVGIFWVVVYSWHILQPATAYSLGSERTSCSFKDCVSTCVSNSFMTENKNFSTAPTP